MSGRKNVLVVGIDPALIDFSSPDYAGFNLNAQKVMAGLEASADRLRQLGCDVTLCLTDFGITAESTLRDSLKNKQYDCIVIGAGIRVVPSNLLLFEKVINLIHADAPHAKICFNTNPNDTVEAVRRWV